jgi:hypothetical protein
LGSSNLTLARLSGCSVGNPHGHISSSANGCETGGPARTGTRLPSQIYLTSASFSRIRIQSNGALMEASGVPKRVWLCAVTRFSYASNLWENPPKDSKGLTTAASQNPFGSSAAGPTPSLEGLPRWSRQFALA